jgi:protocatechuate 3,4-dioxygenase beta subunit
MVHSEYQKYKGLTPTGPDIIGPFYRKGAPFRSRLDDRPGLILSGKVVDTGGQAMQNASLDFWQADANGDYDNDSTEFRYRGVVQTDWLGRWRLETVIPGDYKISEPGQPDEYRCAHVHVILTAPGYKSLTTQLYFPDDPYNNSDHWFDSKRVVNLGIPTRMGRQGTFDFVLEPSL